MKLFNVTANASSIKTFTFAMMMMVSLFTFAGTKARATRFNQLGFKEATHQANYRNKPMFMYIGSATCLQSKRQEDIFKMGEVAEQLNSKFYCNKFDCESFGGLLKASMSWGVKSYPTIIFFATNGKMIYKEEGYKSKDKLLELIAKGEEMIAEYQAKHDKKDKGSEEQIASIQE